MSTNSSSKVDPAEWISQSEAARIRGVSRQAIHKLVKKGSISTLEIGGHVLVNRNELESFEPKEPGRPKSQDSA